MPIPKLIQMPIEASISVEGVEQPVPARVDYALGEEGEVDLDACILGCGPNVLELLSDDQRETLTDAVHTHLETKDYP